MDIDLYREIIVSSITELGFLHRGTEKLIEARSIGLSLGYYDRLDYVSTMIMELSFVVTIEICASMFVSFVVTLSRIVVVELLLASNHLLASGCHLLDIGIVSSCL